MTDINAGKLATDMLAAVKGKLEPHWNAVAPFARTEMEKLAATAVQIKIGAAAGTLPKAQADILLSMQANASQAVLTAVETVGMIAAQDAINAALNVLKDAVNKAIGFAFL
jgi:hypothetical protein